MYRPFAAKDLPVDAWRAVAEAGPLSQRDLAALACTCRELRHVGKTLNCERGIRVSQRGDGHFDARAWQDLENLELVGCGVYGLAPRPVDSHAVIGDLWRLRRLRRLALHNADLPATGGVNGFWARLFRGCPQLEDVQVYGGFRMRKYSSDVAHFMDLVRLGAPRLRSLDIEGGWLVLYTATPSLLSTTSALSLASATQIDRMLAMPPTVSTTLRHYRCASHQTPLGVDAPLLTLCVDEPSVPPLAMARMGDVTRASVQDLTWSACWRVFDAGLLRGFRSLRRCSLTLLGSSTAFVRVAEAVATLRHLPEGVQDLAVHVETWCVDDYGLVDAELDAQSAAGATGATGRVSWPAPLSHLRCLRSLDVELTAPTGATAQLLGHWLGAGPSLRTARMAFWQAPSRQYELELLRLQEENAGDVDEHDEYVVELRRALARASQPLEAPGLIDWLDAHQHTVATIQGLPALVTKHPRLHHHPNVFSGQRHRHR